MKIKIVIIGLGCLGVNVINYMIENNYKNDNYYILDTDLCQLKCSKVKDKSKWVLLGEESLVGLSAGCDVNLGKIGTEEKIENIKNILKSYDLMIIAIGLGKGTGTGGLPVILDAAKELGLKTLSCLSLPFDFEIKRIHDNAKMGLGNIKNSDITITFKARNINKHYYQIYTEMDKMICYCIINLMKEKILSEEMINSIIEKTIKEYHNEIEQVYKYVSIKNEKMGKVIIMLSNGLDRYISAQKEDYNKALEEIKKGKKESHWIWYIFPQYAGLGFSYEAYYYGIKSKKEAIDYYNNEYLRNNLIEITTALLNINTNKLSEVVSITDYYKIRSCMTLFYNLSNNELFKDVLDKYYKGTFDNITLELLNKYDDIEISTTADLEYIHELWEETLKEHNYYVDDNYKKYN